MSDSIYVTVGEDCTCRVWNTKGDQLMNVREHNGRGIWRCLFDPNTSLIITAGFDSGIKVHRLCASHDISAGEDNVLGNLKDKEEIFSFFTPKYSELQGSFDSKSEYVRCLQFSKENVLYVATNNSFLYHLQLSIHGDGKWTQLARVSDKGPIICLDLITLNSSDGSLDSEDVIAVGDGKGNATIVRVVNPGFDPITTVCITWAAEVERRLLGVHWCKSLGCSHLFTVDPGGALKCWSITGASYHTDGDNKVEPRVSLVATFQSIFSTRIMCMDAVYIDEFWVLGCGDQRGNISIFLFPNAVLSSNELTARKIMPTTQFRSAHGISSVTNVTLAILNQNEIEIHTTGGDGCICLFKLSCITKMLEFMGMRQVKGLSIVKSIIGASRSNKNFSDYNYADGFTSTDYIVWDLVDELKIKQVFCGGWRRPYSCYFGRCPEIQRCFAFVKDHMIHVHRHWMPLNINKICSKVIHMQFHGREIHTLCFISFKLQVGLFPSDDLLLATGCEDGTVRLTRYRKTGIDAWSCSQLLGEHVGGSAVRSICFISKIYTATNESCKGSGCGSDRTTSNDQFLLISVGAKQVLTSWLLNCKPSSNRAVESTMSADMADANKAPYLSFQWLSTHIPAKISNVPQKGTGKVSISKSPDATCYASGLREGKTSLASVTKNENDWRYMAVTCFIVKTPDSRFTVCFIVVAGSDATVVLRALLLPHRLWFDVASLVSQPSPVLTLKHVVPSHDCQTVNAFIIIGGSTCGVISFWDVTNTVQHFLESLGNIPFENMDWQKRPRTGRGSQGGRWWKLASNPLQRGDKGRFPKKGCREKGHESQSHVSSTDESTTVGLETTHDETNSADAVNSHSMNGGQCKDSQSDHVHDVKPMFVLDSVHQSGVNCLHVTETHKSLPSTSGNVYSLVSGGDDQSLHSLIFSVEWQTTCASPEENDLVDMKFPTEDLNSRGNCTTSMVNNGRIIRLLSSNKVISAHNSAVKGVWTDGFWVFSTGLDQRIRCWLIGDFAELVEYDHWIICVPEPESLDAIVCKRNHYQIAVAGRGMQMVEFIADSADD